MAKHKKKFSFCDIVKNKKSNNKSQTESKQLAQGDAQKQTCQLTSEESLTGKKRKSIEKCGDEKKLSNDSGGTQEKQLKKLKTDEDLEEVILLSEEKIHRHRKKKKNKGKDAILDKSKEPKAVVIDLDAPDTNAIEIPDDDMGPDDIVLVTDEEQESAFDNVIEIESDPEVKIGDKYRKKGKKKNTQGRERSRFKRYNKKEQLEQMVQNLPNYDSLDERLDCIRLEDSLLLVIDHPCQLALSGSASLHCLLGSIQVLGFDLDLSHSETDVYSPSVGSCLTLATQSSGTNKQMVIDHLKQSEEINWKKLEDILEQIRSPVIIKIKNAKSHICSVKTYKDPFSQLFRTKENGVFSEALQPLGVSIYNIEDPDLSYIRVGEDLQSLVMEWNSKVEQYSKGDKKPLVIVICGSRNSGKSTTNRLLINNTLNRLDCVFFLDCDVGQSEFTPPGCLSLVKVTEPVLGPPFTHQRKPECCFFYGGLSPADNPNFYIESLIKCVQFYGQVEKSAPLIVNTMGWIEDLGLQLLTDTIRLVKPTHVIQLQTRSGDEMIDKLFESPSWTDTSSTKFPECKLSKEIPVPNCLYIKPSPSNSKFKPGNARELRDLTIVGYFYQNLEPGLNLYSASPHVIKWTNIAIHVCHRSVPKSQIMYALNTSLVALCQTDLTMTYRPFEDGPLFFKKVPVFSWKGYGIVRGIDMKKKLLYIITPLTSDELQKVNTIVKGSVMIPEQVLLNKSLKSLPYVDVRISSFGEKELRPKKKPKPHGRPKD